MPSPPHTPRPQWTRKTTRLNGNLSFPHCTSLGCYVAYVSNKFKAVYEQFAAYGLIRHQRPQKRKGIVLRKHTCCPLLFVSWQ
eukprot:1256355-Amphidinium_carterae.1